MRLYKNAVSPEDLETSQQLALSRKSELLIVTLIDGKLNALSSIHLQ